MGKRKKTVTTLEDIRRQYVDEMLGEHADEFDVERILQAIAMPVDGGWMAADIKLEDYTEIVKASRREA